MKESLCPICGRAICDHTSYEREQTDEERRRPLKDYEQGAFDSGSDQRKINAARRSQAEAENAEYYKNKK